MARLLLCAHESDKPEAWAAALEARIGDHELVCYPEIGLVEKIDFAAVSRPPYGLLSSLPNLQAVISLWAGLEHCTGDPDFPGSIPLYRMIEPGLSTGMVQYVLGHVLSYHLHSDRHHAAEARCEWLPDAPPLAPDRTVGVMGLGVLGLDVARELVRLGFCVLGWSRTAKHHPGITCYHGEEALPAFLGQSHILVLLLPSSPATHHIMGRRNLALLPQDAALINAGRGSLIHDAALLEALDQGQLRGATLDVFMEEPLPQDHPYWRHELVRVTPHIASITRPETGAVRVMEVIEACLQGRAIQGRYDRLRGY